MSKRATEGAQLGELVCLALPACRLAERQCSRRILGRPPRFSDTVFSILIMVAVLQRRKSKSAQYRYLMQHRHSLMELLSLDSFPCRSTYFLRYQRMHSIIKRAVEIQGRRLIRRGVADAHAIAVDKTLVASQGRCWHQRDRKAGKAPPVGVDLGGQWGYSEHRGWVFGYGANIAVSSGKNGAVCPLWISVDPANVKEQRSVVDLVDKLPAQTQYVVTDRGYDSNELCERIENSRPKEHGGRRFVCRPQKPKRIAKELGESRPREYWPDKNVNEERGSPNQSWERNSSTDAAKPSSHSINGLKAASTSINTLGIADLKIIKHKCPQPYSVIKFSSFTMPKEEDPITRSSGSSTGFELSDSLNELSWLRSNKRVYAGYGE